MPLRVATTLPRVCVCMCMSVGSEGRCGCPSGLRGDPASPSAPPPRAGGGPVPRPRGGVWRFPGRRDPPAAGGGRRGPRSPSPSGQRELPAVPGGSGAGPGKCGGGSGGGGHGPGGRAGRQAPGKGPRHPGARCQAGGCGAGPARLGAPPDRALLRPSARANLSLIGKKCTSPKTSKNQIKVDLVDENFTELRGEIAGPPDTPYEGGQPL
ncbi:ubiquitin-conjugating enzyme E2 K isoform 4-T4 [Ara ararauna]